MFKIFKKSSRSCYNYSYSPCWSNSLFSLIKLGCFKNISQHDDPAPDARHSPPCVFIYLQTSIDVIPLTLSLILPVIPLSADK